MGVLMMYKRGLQIVLVAAVILLVVMLLIVSSVLGVVGTELGRVWVGQQLVPRLMRPKGINLEIEGLRWPSLGELSARHIVVQKYQEQDNQAETLLEARQFLLRWVPTELRQKKVHVKELSAVELHYTALASSSTKKDHTDATKPALDLTSFPVITVDKLLFPALGLYLRGPQAAIPLLNLTGQVTLLDPKQPVAVSLDAHTVNDISSDLSVKINTFDLTSMHITGRLKEAAGGWLSHLLALPVQQGLDAQFDAIVEKNSRQLALNLQTLTLPLFTHRVEVMGEALVDLDQSSVTLKQVEIKTDDDAQYVTGSFSPQALTFKTQLLQLPLTLVKPWVKDLHGGAVSGVVSGDWVLTQKGRLPDIVADLQLTALHYATHHVSGKVKAELKDRLVRIKSADMTADAINVLVNGVLDPWGEANQLTLNVAALHTDDLRKVPELAQLSIPESLHVGIHDTTVRLQGAIRDPSIHLETQAEGEYQGQAFEVVTRIKATRRDAFIQHVNMTTQGTEFDGEGTLDWTESNNDFHLNFRKASQDLLKFAPLTLQASIAEKIPQKWLLSSDGSVTLSGSFKTPRVTLDTDISGEYFVDDTAILPYHVRTISALTLGAADKRELNIERLIVGTYRQPVLDVRGHYQAGNFDFDFNLQRLPARALTTLGVSAVSGEAVAKVKVFGTLAAPQIEGQIQYQNTVFTKEHRELPVRVLSQIHTDQGVLSLITRFHQNETSLGRVYASVPLEKTVTYFLQQPVDVQAYPLDLRFRVKSDLNILGVVLDPGLHSLGGVIDADLHVSGTPLAPDVVGYLKLDNGFYLGTTNGVDLRHVSVDLVSEQQTVTLKKALAETPEDGRLQMEGRMRWHRDERLKDNAIELQFTANKAHLIQRQEAQGALTGDVHLQGSFENLTLNGALNVSPLNVNLNSGIKTSIPEIEVFAVENETSASTKSASKMPEVALNLKFVVDHQAYLRGRGLETEIGGEVLIAGSAKNPEIVGEFNTKRGKLDALGKTFVLQNGSVRLSNSVVGLRIPGVHTSDGYEYTVEVYGTSEAPKLRLSSVPALPEDEILSRLIFGKSIQEITPFQAIRLASAIRTLSNGSSFDPLDKTRSALGIDTLNIDNEQTDTGSNVNVGIGKYINERVYVEIERSSDLKQPWKGSVQMEVSPRVSLEVGTGDSGAGDAEVIWKKDY